MKTIRVAAGVIQRENDEVLAVRRGHGEQEGLWEFPGGKIENGEEAADACRRELDEELGIKITSLQDFYTLEYDYPDFHLSMNCFFCHMDGASDEPQARDGQRELRWVRKSSLATLEWAPADVELAEVLVRLAEGDEANTVAAGTGQGAGAHEDAGASGRAKRQVRRQKGKRRKPDLLDGVDTSALSESERHLVRRRAAVRKSMQGNKRRDTKPELLVRKRLREAGLSGYRLDWAKAPGRPDIAFPGRKIAIFVNGCYWHRCPHCNPSMPSKNVEFWQAKFRRNVERDARALVELEQLGWHAITIWECELKRDRIDETMAHVIEKVREVSSNGRSRATGGTQRDSVSEPKPALGPCYSPEPGDASEPDDSPLPGDSTRQGDAPKEGDAPRPAAAPAPDPSPTE